MEEGVLTLLGHSIADSTASVRLELGRLCEYMLSQRFTRVFAIVEPDLQLLSVLLMLSRDDAAEVCNTATQVCLSPTQYININHALLHRTLN